MVHICVFQLYLNKVELKRRRTTDKKRHYNKAKTKYTSCWDVNKQKIQVEIQMEQRARTLVAECLYVQRLKI